MRRKQQPINKNNQNENMNRKPHYYTVREKVLVRNKKRKNIRIRANTFIL